jgi:ankyrin repeat protein
MATNLLDPAGDCAALSALLGAIHNHQPIGPALEVVKCRRRVNARDAGGRSPVSFAAACGNFSAVEALVVAGADVRLQDDNGITPLHYAVQSGSVAVTQQLMAYGAATVSTALTLDTPLHFAAAQGRFVSHCVVMLPPQPSPAPPLVCRTEDVVEAAPT